VPVPMRVALGHHSPSSSLPLPHTNPTTMDSVRLRVRPALILLLAAGITGVLLIQVAPSLYLKQLLGRGRWYWHSSSSGPDDWTGRRDLQFSSGSESGTPSATPTPTPTPTCTPSSTPNKPNPCYGQGEYYDPYTNTCVPCPSGEELAMHGQGCSPCEVGTYREAASGMIACAPCPEGYFASHPRAVACVVCPSTCPKCDSRTGVCVACEPGFGAVVGSAGVSCVRCNPGEASPGASPCAPCNAGYYSPRPGASVCNVCEHGKFSSDATVGGGATACALCPSGFEVSS
jgi:hypothetical protein